MRIGVIGWGLRRGIALIAHKPEEGRRIVALADPSEQARQNFLSAVEGAVAVPSLNELLEMKLDAIFVLSPDWLHEEQGVQCLEAGIPIYLEKPMAITVAGCDRVLDAARRTGTKLYVGHNMRHFAVVRKMKEWIDAGKIGEVKAAWCRHFIAYGGEAYFRDWHADRSKSTGLLLQKGAHDLDVIHWLCGAYSRRVTAFGKLAVYGDIEDRLSAGETGTVKFTNLWPPLSMKGLNAVVDVEDISMMLMEMDNGILGSYQQCHFAPDAWRNYTIIGTEGRIENFGDTTGKATVRLWNSRVNGYRLDGDEEWEAPLEEGLHGGADNKTVAEFLAYIESGAETDATAEAARMAVAAGVAGTESLRNGGVPVTVG